MTDQERFGALSPHARVQVQHHNAVYYMARKTYRKPERRKRWKQAQAEAATLRRKVLGVEPWAPLR